MNLSEQVTTQLSASRSPKKPVIHGLVLHSTHLVVVSPGVACVLHPVETQSPAAFIQNPAAHRVQTVAPAQLYEHSSQFALAAGPESQE